VCLGLACQYLFDPLLHIFTLEIDTDYCAQRRPRSPVRVHIGNFGKSTRNDSQNKRNVDRIPAVTSKQEENQLNRLGEGGDEIHEIHSFQTPPFISIHLPLHSGLNDVARVPSELVFSRVYITFRNLILF